MSARRVSIEISDVRDGWAIATVRAGNAEYKLDGFSYTTPAFDELARFGVDVALDAVDVEIVLDAEPSGWLWEFRQRFGPPPQQHPTLTFSISEMKYSDERNSPNVKVFSVEVERDQLAGAILASLRELESRIGIDAFEQTWMGPYPVRGVIALEAALATQRRFEPALEPVSVHGSKHAFYISVETPLSDDVRALVKQLNEFTFELTPAEYRHHMSVEQMAGADTMLFVARDSGGATLGMGALRRHGDVGEVKRMFVKREARGLGVGGAILERIEALARQEGLTRLVLETGSNFDAAKRVYERGGFQACEPVLDYPPSAWTAFYAKPL